MSVLELQSLRCNRTAVGQYQDAKAVVDFASLPIKILLLRKLQNQFLLCSAVLWIHWNVIKRNLVFNFQRGFMQKTTDMALLSGPLGPNSSCFFLLIEERGLKLRFCDSRGTCSIIERPQWSIISSLNHPPAFPANTALSSQHLPNCKLQPRIV